MAIQYPPVSLTEYVITAGAPDLLQKTVAFVSFGDTSLAVGTRKLVTKLADISDSINAGSYLSSALSTFFGMGSATCYVVELGANGASIQATAKATLATTNTYTVSSLAVKSGGTGWAVGDAFTVPGATGKVSTVTAGAVTGVTIDEATAQTIDPAGDDVVASASGSSLGEGLTLTVSSTTATVTTGAIAGITVDIPGSGYVTQPTVSIVGNGTEASAVATVSGGSVSGITLTNPGQGYTAIPTITISAPYTGKASLLQTYLNNNPRQNYLYILDAASSQDTDIQAITKTYDSYLSYTVFLLTLSVAQSKTYGSHKGGIVFSPSADQPSTEFGASVIAYMFASLSPSVSTKITPFNYRFVTGVTPYADVSSNDFQAVIGTNTNVIIPATAGGLDSNMLLGGQYSDGNAINLWYGADYASLSATRRLAQIIIEGSNNGVNPLFFDQQGINRLSAGVKQTLNKCIDVGAIIGPIDVEAIDFATYALANPDLFKDGIYTGISFTVIPARGFNAITYVMTVDFTASTVSITTA